MPTSPRMLALVTAGLVGGALSACDGATDVSTAGTGGPIKVKASDSACEVPVSTLPAGTHVFTITNTGTKVTEFYVYAAGDRVMGEVENITPGLTRELRVELPAGTYQTACKPGMTGNRHPRRAHRRGLSAAPLTEDAALAAGDRELHAVHHQRRAARWWRRPPTSSTAVKAGDIAKAKALYPVARTY